MALVQAMTLSGLVEFVDRAVSGGYLIAMSLVCLLQYAFHLHVKKRSRLEREQFKREVQGL